MPSTNKTTRGLNLWIESDKPSMEDFNRDNERIDLLLAHRCNSPYVGANGNWCEWDEVNQMYRDTGVAAGGAQGEQGPAGASGARGEIGPQGDKGDKGAPGTSLHIIGTYPTLGALQTSVSSPNIGDMYNVGTAPPYDIYLWDGVVLQWKNLGQLQGAAGANGEPGPKGEAGEQGPQGSAGRDGLTTSVNGVQQVGGNIMLVSENIPHGVNGNVKAALDAIPASISGSISSHDSNASAHSAQFATKAPLVSPTLTGTPTAPTPVVGDNSTKIATTKFVDTALSTKLNASEKGAANGVVPLGSDTRIAQNYLPVMLKIQASSDFTTATLPNGAWGGIY